MRRKEQERGPGSAGASGDGEVEHFADFIDAVISRNKADKQDFRNVAIVERFIIASSGTGMI